MYLKGSHSTICIWAEQHVTCEMLEVVVGSEECPDLVVEGEDGREGEQELQRAHEDVVRQVVVVIPVLNRDVQCEEWRSENLCVIVL